MGVFTKRVPYAKRVPFKNGKLTTVPSAQNPVMKVKKFCKCPYKCTRKTFNTVWKMHLHFVKEHNDWKSYYPNYCNGLAQEVIGEMI